jgi:thioredoxin 1
MKSLLTLNDFVNDVFKTDLAVVDFWAEWCNPCKKLEPILEEFERKHTHIKFFKVNVEHSPSIAEIYSIQGLPTLAFFKNGVLIDTFVGMPGNSAILEEKIKNHK